MGRFVVQENWGRGDNRSHHKDWHSGRRSMEDVIRRSQGGASFLFKDQPIETFHHEPRKSWLVANGIVQPDNPRFLLGMSFAEHGLFHYAAYMLFKDQVDWDAVNAMTANMTEEQCIWYDENSCNLEIMNRIKEIIRRRRVLK